MVTWRKVKINTALFRVRWKRVFYWKNNVRQVATINFRILLSSTQPDLIGKFSVSNELWFNVFFLIHQHICKNAIMILAFGYCFVRELSFTWIFQGVLANIPCPNNPFILIFFFLLFYMQLNTGYTVIIGSQGF